LLPADGPNPNPYYTDKASRRTAFNAFPHRRPSQYPALGFNFDEPSVRFV
jgi:hypothetical protein